MLAKLDKLDIAIIQDFRRTGNSMAIPAELQQYIIELDKVAEIWAVNFEHNRSRIARKLVEFFPHLGFLQPAQELTMLLIISTLIALLKRRHGIIFTLTVWKT